MEKNPAMWFGEASRFLSEVRVEFNKITWPTQKEAVGGTIGVIVIVTVITLALSVVDAALGWGVRTVLP